MAPGLEAARALVELDADRGGAADRPRAADRVARRRGRRARSRPRSRPAARDLGVMLPYSPLHHLLLADVGAPLVMTSGNRLRGADRLRDDDALRAAGADRRRVPGPRPADPRCATTTRWSARSARRLRAEPLVLRRSRGYGPAGVPLPLGGLAAGARLRGRAQEHVLPRAGRARLGRPPHRGPAQLGDAELVPRGRRALPAPVRGRARARRPRPASRLPLDRLRAGARGRRARRRAASPRPPRRLPGRARRAGPAVGAIFDGSGYGPDGTVWGGEFLVGGLARYERAGLPVPGAAARRRRRRAGALADGVRLAGRGARTPSARSCRRLAGEVDPRSWDGVCELVATGVNSPPTTSAGRLFDAVAALCGLRRPDQLRGPGGHRARGCLGAGRARPYPIAVIDPGPEGPLIVDPRETVPRCWPTSTPTRRRGQVAPGSTPPSRGRRPRRAR